MEIWIVTDHANCQVTIGVIVNDIAYMIRHNTDLNDEIIDYAGSDKCTKKEFFETCDHPEYFEFEKIFG